MARRANLRPRLNLRVQLSGQKLLAEVAALHGGVVTVVQRLRSAQGGRPIGGRALLVRSATHSALRRRMRDEQMPRYPDVLSWSSGDTGGTPAGRQQDTV